MTTDPSAEERRLLLEANLESIFRAWHQARNQGEAQPVVWILGLRRPRPVAIAERLGIDVPAVIQSAAAEGGIPTAVVALGKEASVALAGTLTDNGASICDERVGPGLVRVVVVAGGGNLYTTVPVPMAPDAD